MRMIFDRVNVLFSLVILFSSFAFTFELNGVDACFSPRGSCADKLISFIDSAEVSLDVAIYSLTHAGIAQSIINAKQRGVKVRVVADTRQAKGNGSLVKELEKKGVNIKYGSYSGIMHNKFAVVDSRYVETGSYNYTENAEQNNAENQIYFKDESLVNKFSDNFQTIWQKAKTASSTAE